MASIKRLSPDAPFSPQGDHVTPAPNLRAVTRAIVEAGGSEPHEAALVAEQLVAANLGGHDSHGIGMLPRYVDALLARDLLPNQHVRAVSDAGSFIILDGNFGYGQVIGREAMAVGIARARQTGIAVLGLRNAHHLGRIGHWAEQCAEAGLVSIHFVNVITRPIVAPWGGGDARVGTNPFTVGIPRLGERPVIVEFRHKSSRTRQSPRRV